MFFVSGITGKVGGAVAQRLLEKGCQVRALVREPSKAADWVQKGVEVRQGNFDDAASVADAMQSVEGAFLMMPPVLSPAPDSAEAKATVASYLAVLRQTPPPRLVVLSSVGSQQGSGLGNITSTHLLEQALHEVALSTAIVRAGSFIENYLYGLEMAEATGSFDILLTPTNRKVPMVATVDIGHEIAHLLADGWNGKKIVELGSRISPDDLALAMSEVLGKPVHARSVPREQWSASLQHQGFPAGATGAYEEMMDSFNSGWIDFGMPGTEPVAGKITAAEVFAHTKKPEMA